MYRSLAFSAFFVLATAGTLALSSTTTSSDDATGAVTQENPRLARGFRGDRRPGILHEPSEHPVNPGENGVYYHYDFTRPEADDPS